MMREANRAFARPNEVVPAIGGLPIFYLCHPVAPREGERCWRCNYCATHTASIDESPILACGHPPSCWTGPGGADVVKANVANARRWWRWLATWDEIAAVAPWMVNVEEWSIRGGAGELGPLVERGLRDDCAVVARLDGVILCNRVGRGSAMERDAALAAGRRAYDLTFLGAYPPDGDDDGPPIRPQDVNWERAAVRS